MFINITESEAVYIMAAIGRVSSHGNLGLLEKLGDHLTVTELHEVERLYQDMRFSSRGDTSVNMVELYHNL